MKNAAVAEPTPVTTWENDRVNGLALAGEAIFRDTVTEAEELRARQAAYRATLPTDPVEKCKAIREIWISDDYYSGGTLREAQVIAFALESMVASCDPENVPEEREAMRWLTARLIDCQRAEYRRIDRAMDILQRSR